MKLEALKSAARQTVAVINAARALPEGDRRELDLALKHADSLVAKAAQVVRESSDRDAVEAAEAEAELQKLKATIAAAKVVGTEEPSQASADEDEDEKGRRRAVRPRALQIRGSFWRFIRGSGGDRRGRSRGARDPCGGCAGRRGDGEGEG